MSGAAVLGIDLGTSSVKVCWLTAAGERTVATAAVPTACPQPLWAEQQPADWLTAVAAAVRQLLPEVEPRKLRGVGLTSAAHIGVLLDAADQPLRPAILWHDQRAAAAAADLEARAGERILAISRQAVAPSWTLAQLAWVRQDAPGLWSAVRRVVWSKDYLLHWLTGEWLTDLATAVSGQLYDDAAACWSSELAGLVELRPEWLPTVVPPQQTAGGLRPAVAAVLGLPAGTPVVVGSLDSACELLAAGARLPGQGVLRLATAGGLQVVVAGPTASRRRITYPHLAAPWWYCQAGTNTCAAAVAWAARLLGGGAEPDFTAFDRLANSAPLGCEGLLFQPYLAGERAPYWDPHLRAGFLGATLHHGPAHFARAVYEGTACSLRDALQVLDAVPASGEPWGVVGGGSRSALWVELLANLLQRPLQPLPEVDSALGAALWAAASLGLGTRAAAASTAPCRPTELAQERLTAVFARYQEAHRALAGFYARPGPPS